ncbi:MAG: LON peptidase substrate-binding domain-containing protein [Gammaproteobacteria bacterium]|nr:LON peptidase substrate-binding domain-containing protein [Gammaproteobacteria bacterium]MDH5693589.1 LON peptidase substrate-binding domain-containing protein [Gammaproteobacteria bacterium]
MLVIDAELPLLPLHTVLFPGTRLPLKIFETRYIDMLRDCFREGTQFGVCLIREGEETGLAPKAYEMGTVAHVEDWELRKDGFLGVNIKGGKRFRILSESVRPNQLLVGDIEYISEQEEIPTPEHFSHLQDLLETLIARAKKSKVISELNYESSSWLGYRLAELLPLRLSQRQYFLQLEDSLVRLERINGLLQDLGYIR